MEPTGALVLGEGEESPSGLRIPVDGVRVKS